LTDVKVSEMTSGVKSFFLKLIDPLFAKKGMGAIIPIRIGGTPDSPSFGLDSGRVFSSEEMTSPANRPGEEGDWRKVIPSCSEVLATEGNTGG